MGDVDAEVQAAIDRRWPGAEIVEARVIHGVVEAWIRDGTVSPASGVGAFAQFDMGSGGRYVLFPLRAGPDLGTYHVGAVQSGTAPIAGEKP